MTGPRMIFVDFETFWSAEYTIAKTDPPSYILDPRFEAICLGIADGWDEPPHLIDGPEIPAWLASLTDDVIMVSHNALFDMAILSWRYGYTPRVIVDTLSIARTLLGHKFRHLDLGTVAKYFGMLKGDMLTPTKGMTRTDILASGLWGDFTGYCLQDVAICRRIARNLLPLMPPEEIVLHDMVARCAVEPAFRLNTDIMFQHHADVIEEKDKLLAHAALYGATKDQLMSNPQFAEVLKAHGVEPPLKTSPTTGERTLAFAKKDPEFLALLEHDSPAVQALVEARMGVKSTIEETRTHRMLNIASLDFPHHGGTGLMPIPLIVGAAHTHRLGGGWKINPQNWGRKSPIRKAITAPEGTVVIAADSSQIEARMNAWFCDQHDLVQAFRNGEDVYASFASEVYGRRVTRESDPRARQVGKVGILQLGYQSGSAKFKDTLWVDTYPDTIAISDFESYEVVQTYRMRYARIKATWRWLQNVAIPILAGTPTHITELNLTVSEIHRGCIAIRKGEIEGPTGLKLYYDELHQEDGEWWFAYGGIPKKLYGGKLLENIIQFLARCVVMSAAVRLKKPLAEFHTRLTHSSHDEIVYLAPHVHVEQAMALIRAEMNRPPEWAPTLPLACDVRAAANYGDAK